MTKPRVFWTHFNRLNVQRGDKDVWTVHFSDRCIQTKHVDIRVPVQTVYKGATARQPRAYLRGVGRVKFVKRGVVLYA